MTDYLILVNKRHTLSRSFKPGCLKRASQTLKARNIRVERDDIELNEVALWALNHMMLEAQRDGVFGFLLESGYRSYDYQRRLYEKSMAAHVPDTPLTVASPGASEHQTGLAVDIASEDFPALDEGFANTSHGAWLCVNAHRFGYILRYPRGKERVTGIAFEPWHFRFVGKKNAGLMKHFGVCLEEYILN